MDRFAGFSQADFDVFAIPTLEGRMEGIKHGPRPKLAALGQDLAPELSGLAGHQLYPIVALHARRKVNPPNDTWVAWSPNKRGYKMVPHFEVGLWHTHAFIQAGVIYQSMGRDRFAANLLASLPAVRAAIPPHFRWLEDSTGPQGILHKDMTEADFRRIAEKLATRKESDCMVGLAVDRADVIRSGPAFADLALGILEKLLPIYRLAEVPLQV